MGSEQDSPQGPHGFQVIKGVQVTAGGRSTRASSPDPYAEFVEAIEQGRLMSLPLVELLSHAGRYQQDKTEDEQPEFGHDWRSPLFVFCWVLRGHPDLASLDADSAFQQIERTLRNRVPRRCDVWWEFIGVDRETALSEFPVAWDTVRVPLGCSPLALAAMLADERPLLTEADLAEERSKLYLKLVNITAWLAFCRGGNFFLSHRCAGELVECDQRHAATLLKLAVSDRLLRVVQRGQSAATGGNATVYEFRLDSLPGGALETAERVLGRRLRDDGSDES